MFGVDGTLVDTVNIHATCWQEAFRLNGHNFQFADIRSQIGKGGDQLMPVFLSPAEIERDGKQMEAFRASIIRNRFFPQITGFPRVCALMEELISRGTKIVLASSAKKDELEFYK
jgi:beta-phosphoglucomutase-like phosphatase (HAD superfamily)